MENLNNIDIVYFVKNNNKSPELIHSVRSVVQNFPFYKIWFVGGCPEGVIPDGHIPIQPVSKIKNVNTNRMMRAVCDIPLITDKFAFFNDDFFVMDRVEELPPYYYGTLEETSAKIKTKYGKETVYTDLLDAAASVLKGAGLSTFNFDLHMPMIIDKEKMREIIKMFPNIPCKRSLYGNYYGLAEIGVEKADVKIHDFGDCVLDDKFVSTDDQSFAKGVVGKAIREKFKTPSAVYEPRQYGRFGK